jgi:hypothetical protein
MTQAATCCETLPGQHDLAALSAGGAPLAACLEAAVPLWIAVTAALGADRQALMAAESARVLDAATWPGGGELPAPVASHLARTVAIAAAAPSGVTFAGRHWCTAPHGGCPGPGQPDDLLLLEHAERTMA